MPHIELGSVHGVYVKIDASEASASELKTLATQALSDACRILAGEPVPPAGAATIETRWTPDHRDANYSSRFGFAPVKAEMGDGDV